jgi:hypothetical protein
MEMAASSDFAEAPVLDTLAGMTADRFERPGPGQETCVLLRIAALVATGASPASYSLGLGTAGDAGAAPEAFRGRLVAPAPAVGSAHTVSAASSMEKAFGYALMTEQGDG